MAVESATLGAGAKKGLVKNVFSLGLVQIANYVFPLITVTVVARIIGPDKLGVINFASAFMAYFTILINFGFDLSATRVIAANRNNLEIRNRIFNQVLLAKCILLSISVVLFLVSLYSVPLLRSEKLVAVFSFLLCVSWVITPNWLYQGMQELTKVALFNLVAKIIFTGVVLLVVREKSDYIWQPLALTISQVIVGVFSFFYAVRRYDITLRLAKLGTTLRLLWNERVLFFSMVVINLYTTTNVVLLGFLQNEEQVGYYTAGWRLILMVQSVLAIPLSQALFPFVGAAFAGSREKGIDVVKQLLPVITVLTGVAAVLLWLFGSLIILLIYGRGFEAAIPVFRILSVVPILIGWGNLLGVQTMINLKMDKPFFRITLVGALTSFALNFLLVTRFGYIGTAWCWALTETFISVSMFVVLYRHGINIFDKKYFSVAHFRKFIRPVVQTVVQKIKK